MYTQKIAIIFDHIRAIMSLDHSRLDLENKFLENKWRQIFCVRQVYFTKSCQQNWGGVNQPFILFIHHIWDEKVLWGAVFIIQTSGRMHYFTIFQDRLHSVNIQDDQWWAFSETVQKKSPKSPLGPAGCHFWQAPNLQYKLCSSVWTNINRVMVKHKELIMFSIY